jgi:hypothetical protein
LALMGVGHVLGVERALAPGRVRVGVQGVPPRGAPAGVCSV